VKVLSGTYTVEILTRVVSQDVFGWLWRTGRSQSVLGAWYPMNKGTTGGVEWMVNVRYNCELGLDRDTEGRRRSVVGEMGATGDMCA